MSFPPGQAFPLNQLNSGYNTLSTVQVYDSTISGVLDAQAAVSGLLTSGSSGSGFNPTNSNDVLLLQIATEQLSAIVTASSNAMKSVYQTAATVLQNIT